MGRVQIGRTVRRLRAERNLSQQALANRLGISASYLNLIEHDQRAVSGTLLIKLAEIFHLDLAALSGVQERRLEVGLREAFSDPLLGVDAVPEAEIAVLAGSGPNAARAVLALYRASRARTPEESPFRRGGASCSRMRKRAISSMTGPITSRASKRRLTGSPPHVPPPPPR